MNILGLAIATSEHHAAALIIDGQVVGAAEEERFNRIKHYGWAPDGVAGGNLLNREGFRVQDAVCRDSVRWVLGTRGLTLADVDLIAINGVPPRLGDAQNCVRQGRYLFVPHHLAHAALAARTSPYASCNVLTIDGRGEHETAAWFVYEDGQLTRRAELRVELAGSIGGAYETVTRALGLGPHGQGQTMALAGFTEGDANAFGAAWVAGGFEGTRVDEAALQRLCEARIESGGEAARTQLAADGQAALEATLLSLVAEGAAEAPELPWALAGGVALNCRANSVIRDALGVPVWVPSSAHDGGTALGAALEAAARSGVPVAAPLAEAGFGASWQQDDIRASLADAGLSARPVSMDEVAGLLGAGLVLGWFHGGFEYGPRALGHRSIVAHPGHPGVQDRVNAIKDRQSWRPFGPSVLAEHADSWFEDSAFGPFMTFTAQVRPERRSAVAGVVHIDGSTRPQAVAPQSGPWRGLIEAFYARTGIPMVLNTSFNGRAEPIVASPADAFATAQRIGLDALVIEGLLVDFRRP